MVREVYTSKGKQFQIAPLSLKEQGKTTALKRSIKSTRARETRELNGPLSLQEHGKTTALKWSIKSTRARETKE